MIVGLVMSNAHGATLLQALAILLRQAGHPPRLIYGGRLGPAWRPAGARHIGWHARPACGRAAILAGACRHAVRSLDGIVITTARYHLEQAMLVAGRTAGVPCVIYHSALFLEARLNTPGAAPRLEYYDVGDAGCVQGAFLRDQLVAAGVRPARVRVLGSPMLAALRAG